MKQYIGKKKTPPKKYKIKRRKREFKLKKGTLEKVVGATLEALFIITLVIGFLWVTFFI